jgi:hypothetical protein
MSNLGYGVLPFNLRDMLFQVPKIPTGKFQAFEAILSTGKVMLTRSSSTFHTEGDCRVNLAEKNVVPPILIRIRRCVTRMLRGPGPQPHQLVPINLGKSPNY